MLAIPPLDAADLSAPEVILELEGQLEDLADDEAYWAAVLSAAPALDHLDHVAALRARMMSLHDLSMLQPPTALVEQLVDLDSFVLVYGRRGSAKSFFAVDLLASVATGRRWHSRPVAQGPVVYVVGEGASGLDQRFGAWFDRQPAAARPGRDRLLVLSEPVNLLKPASVEVFADTCASIGAHLIVLDTLARCMVGGDENSAKDAGLAVEALELIRRRTGACVTAVHHSGKNSDAGARGSSAFEAAADTVLEVGLTDDVVTITCTKQKNHATPNPVVFKLCPQGASVVLGDRIPGDEGLGSAALEVLRGLAAIEVDGGIAATVWQGSMGVRVSSFWRHRKELVTLGLVSNVGTEKQPRYQVSTDGALALSENSHALNESSTSTLSHTPLPLGGESESDSSREATSRGAQAQARDALARGSDDAREGRE